MSGNEQNTATSPLVVHVALVKGKKGTCPDELFLLCFAWCLLRTPARSTPPRARCTNVHPSIHPAVPLSLWKAIGTGVHPYSRDCRTGEPCGYMFTNSLANNRNTATLRRTSSLHNGTGSKYALLTCSPAPSCARDAPSGNAAQKHSGLEHLVPFKVQPGGVCGPVCASIFWWMQLSCWCAPVSAANRSRTRLLLTRRNEVC